MQLRSFNLGYHQEEDRLLLNVHTSAQYHSYWITRRAAIMLADGLQKLLAQQYELVGLNASALHLTQELTAFGHSAALEKYPLTKSEAGSERISSPSLLLYQIRYGVVDSSVAKIAFMDKLNQGFVYNIDRYLLHALLCLLQSQCDQAAWHLKMLTDSQVSSTSPNEQRALH